MACCGRNRRLHQTMTYAQSNGFGARQGVAIFEYVGPTALTVIGARTGRKYGFTHSGSRLEVDPRDQESLAKVPRLRRIHTGS